MISVIVPVYKTEKYLRKCVESIQAQTYRDLEIILVDDGSPDGCPVLCDELAIGDARIKVVHKTNGGQASARNEGLRLAKGEYIGFVDSYDYIQPNMFEVLYDLMNQNDTAFAICGCRTVDEDGITIASTRNSTEPIILDRKALWTEIFGNLNNAVWNKLFKAELMRGITFPEGIIHGEDLLFNLEYLKYCRRAAMVTEPLYSYLKREGSVTKQAFSSKKLYEITSKDMARDIVLTEMPSLAKVADLFSFRARMNILRSITKAGVVTQYSSDVIECEEYIKSNYRNVKSLMRGKEKVEYILYRHFKPIYNIIIKNN